MSSWNIPRQDESTQIVHTYSAINQFVQHFKLDYLTFQYIIMPEVQFHLKHTALVNFIWKINLNHKNLLCGGKNKLNLLDFMSNRIRGKIDRGHTTGTRTPLLTTGNDGSLSLSWATIISLRSSIFRPIQGRTTLLHITVTQMLISLTVWFSFSILLCVWNKVTVKIITLPTRKMSTGHNLRCRK